MKATPRSGNASVLAHSRNFSKLVISMGILNCSRMTTAFEDMFPSYVHDLTRFSHNEP